MKIICIDKMTEEEWMGWYEDVMKTRYGYVPPIFHDDYLIEESATLTGGSINNQGDVLER